MIIMRKLFKFIYITLSLLITIILISIAIFYGYLYFFIPEIELKNSYTPTKIYDNNDNLISSENNYYYEYTNLNNISPYLINAIIAIEDNNFYNHNGYSPISIAKALLHNIKDNGYYYGGSTITQQLAKNKLLTNEKTIKRKLKELKYSIAIENKYTKNQILEDYLNTILFGGNIYGCKMAALYYFNRDVKNLTVSMAAYLAGMIQAPNKYNLFKNIELANERKNYVLKRMYKLNYINEQEYNIEKNISLETLINNNLSYYQEDYLNSYLSYISSLNISQNEIHTYLDKNIQKDLFNIVNEEITDDTNIAIVVLDNKTYGIKALIGNRCNSITSINYATNVKLQPGSTIKPILDYAPAIEYLGYTPATILLDSYHQYSNGENINNFDKKYKGYMTLRDALVQSRNIPALKLYQILGGKRAYEFANKIGIYSDDYYEANSIGGATTGYTLLDLANAYLAFSNLGYYKKASAIKNDTKPKLVMKPSTAFLINNILHGTLKNTPYNLNDTYLMAKTGQTNYDYETKEKYNIPDDTTKDALLIAYTKDTTIGIWIGYNEIKEGRYLDINKKNLPKRIANIILGKYSIKNNYYDLIDDISIRYITIKENKAYLATNDGYYEYFQKGNEPLSYYKDYTIA